MANSTCKGTDCKALILGKDKAPVAFPLRHNTNNRTNLPTTSQILGVRHQKQNTVSPYLQQTIQILPPIPVKYILCCGKRTNVNFSCTGVDVEGLWYVQSEFYSTYNMTVHLRPREKRCHCISNTYSSNCARTYYVDWKCVT
jgi:hypothetical protein